jgi:hypothetical protein
LKFGAAMDVVDLNQFHQPGFFTITFDNKAAFALIVNVFIVKVGELNKAS